MALAAGGAVERLAPAKVNLTLRVTGRRPPGGPHAGYHELDSLIVFAAVGDRLRLAAAESLSLTLAGPFAAGLAGETLENNLALRAARRLAELAGRPPEVAIDLEKNLPVAAGIGGGTADAAAVIDGLCELWSLPKADLDLPALTEALGADLPVCLAGRPCRVSGIGERVEPLPPLPEAALLLVNPREALPTPAVFRARRGGFSPPLPLPGGAPWRFSALAALVAEGGNDLTAAAEAVCPAVGRVLAALWALDPPACGMSGSGATCFALYPTLAAAEAGAARLLERSAAAGWWIAPAALLRPAPGAA